VTVAVITEPPMVYGVAPLTMRAVLNYGERRRVAGAPRSDAGRRQLRRLPQFYGVAP